MIDRLLARIGLASAPPPTAEGLRAVHRAFVSSVPFEDIAVQLGESAPLDPGSLVERVLHGGRGGYCFEVNTVFKRLLDALGFSVTRHEAVVGPRGLDKPTDHLALVATVPGGEQFIVEAGLGEGPLEPLPLAAGRTTIGAFTFTVDGDGWWVELAGSTPGYRFSDAVASLEDFAEPHARMSAPGSRFGTTLVVQQPHDDHIVTLRARTFTRGGSSEVLADEGALAAALSDGFGIDPGALGAERVARLWARAVQQHEQHVAALDS